MKRDRFYCPACEVVGDNADYIECDDHTCGNCGDDYLVLVVITDEGDLLGEALKLCREAFDQLKFYDGHLTIRNHDEDLIKSLEIVLAKAGK